MLTVGDALAKTLAKSQKVTFWSQKMALNAFFLLTAVDDLTPAIITKKCCLLYFFKQLFSLSIPSPIYLPTLVRKRIIIFF